MTKKQLFEMLKNVPDDATILVMNTDWEFGAVTCYIHNPNNTVELYTGDTDHD